MIHSRIPSLRAAALLALPLPFWMSLRRYAHTDSSRCSWPPGWQWRSDSDLQETPRSPKLSLHPRPDGLAAGAPVAFVEPGLPLLGPVLGFVSATVRTSSTVLSVSDWCRVAKPVPAMRPVPLHSTGHVLGAAHD